MLSTTLGFPGDLNHCLVLALEVPGFSQGLLPCHHDLKVFCETGCNGVLLNIIENMK